MKNKRLFTSTEKKVLLDALDYMEGDTPVASANVQMDTEDYEKVLDEVRRKINEN